MASVAQGVRGDVLVAQRGTAGRGGGGMPGDQVLDGAAGEGLAAGTGEQRAGGLAVVLADPGSEHGGGLGGERGDALFAPFGAP